MFQNFIDGIRFFRSGRTNARFNLIGISIMINLAHKPQQKAHIRDQSWLLLLGVDMATGIDQKVVRNIVDTGERILNKNKNDNSVCNQVNSIMTLALLSSDVLHIHTQYSAHVKALDVRVQVADTDYKNPNVVFKQQIYLDKAKSSEQLKELEDLLILLVADATYDTLKHPLLG